MTETTGERRVMKDPLPDMPLSESLHFEHDHCMVFGCTPATPSESEAFKAKQGET